MKANEAPEKLYLSKNIYSTYLYQVPDPDDDTAVEYIQPDAFIDKASGWIEENIKKWYENIRVHGFRGMTPLMIIEFRKYMEGE